MTMKDFAPYFDFETKVKITTSDGKSFVGIITGFEDKLDTESKKDELELDIGKYYIAIEIPDILSVEKVYSSSLRNRVQGCDKVDDLNKIVEDMMKSGKFKIGALIYELQEKGYSIEDINASLNHFTRKYVKATTEFDT